MKKCLLIVAAVLLFSSAAFAQAPPVGYIGLFLDDAHSVWCATGAVPYWPATLYVWFLPSVNGQICAEFAIDYGGDPGIVKIAPTNAGHISVALGALDTGMSVCFVECQNDWHWGFTQGMFINTASKVTIRVIAHPEVNPPTYQFANCLEDFPMEPIISLSNVYINSEIGVDPECEAMGTAPASWGAIKNLYEE
ncbi:MAG TPA: hypothetical protein VLA34_03200 [Candidatus Krumholzibacterium sp.]|nr:hypothetical protein [Candidatus Krumholzibacterium sp.]